MRSFLGDIIVSGKETVLLSMPGKCLDDYLVLHANSQNSNGIIKIRIHVFPALMNTLIENFCCGGYIYLCFSELQIKQTFPLTCI